MLSLMRGFARSPVAMVIIGLLIVGLAAYALPNVFSGAKPRGIISAGDRFVVLGDVNKRLDEQIQFEAMQNERRFTRQDLARNGFAQQVVQQFAFRTALLNFTDSIGIRATRFAVADQIAENPRFNDPVTGAFDLDSYRQAIAPQSITDYETQLTEDSTLNYLQGASRSAVSIPDVLGQVWALSQTEERSIAYVQIPASVGDDIPSPTDDELETFYNERRDGFEEPQRRAVTLLVVSAQDFVDDVEITDADAKDYYDFRIRDYSTPETREVVEFISNDRTAVQSVADKIGAGVPLETVEEESTDATIRRRSYQPDSLDDARYSSAVFGFPEGEVFGPIQSGDEWITAIVTKVTPGVPTPFEDVETEIRDLLAVERSSDVFEEKVESFFDLVGGGFSLEEIAAEMGAPLLKFSPVDNNGRTKGGVLLNAISARPEVLGAINNLAFDGEVSEIIDDNVTGGFALVRRDAQIDSFVPPLSDIKDRVEDIYMQISRRDAVKNAADALTDKAAELGDFDAAAEALGYEVNRPTAPLTLRGGPEGLSRNVLLTALDALQGDIRAVPEQDGAMTVVQVEKIEISDLQTSRMMAPAGAAALSEDVQAEIDNAFLTAAFESVELQINEAEISTYLRDMAGEE